MRPPGHAAGLPGQPPGLDRQAHRARHPDRIAGLGHGRVHEDPVHPELHGDGRVRRRPHAGVHDDRDSDCLLDEQDVLRVEDPLSRSDGRGQRHDAHRARVLELPRHHQVVVRVGHDLEALARQHAGGLDQLARVGEERLLVADHLELDAVREPRRPTQAGDADRLRGRGGAGRVRQDHEAPGVDPVEQRRRIRAREVHAAHGHGHDLGPRRLQRRLHDLVRRVLPSPENQPGRELPVAEAKPVLGARGSSRSGLRAFHAGPRSVA